MTVGKSMPIGQLIQVDEITPNILMCVGMHCLGCPASQAKSLEKTCMVRGIDCDTLVSQVNEVLAARG